MVLSRAGFCRPVLSHALPWGAAGFLENRMGLRESCGHRTQAEGWTPLPKGVGTGKLTKLCEPRPKRVNVKTRR